MSKIWKWFKKCCKNICKSAPQFIINLFILSLFAASFATLFAMLWVMKSVMLDSADFMRYADYAGISEKNKHELIKLIGLGISGVIATLGVLGLLRRAAALDKQNKLTEKRHIQECFNAAIEHLGHRSASARIAAFSELCYLIEIKPDWRKNIFYILCGHLCQTTSNKKYNPYKTNFGIIKPTAEVHNLLDILFSPKNKDDFIFEGLPANLRRANIKGASLDNVDLKEAKMQEAKMQGIKLEKANLQNARMWCAKLQNANLRNINLQGAYLRYANLNKADLHDAKLQGTNLYEAKLQRANLHRANLQGANLHGANLQGANLHGAKINKKTEMPKGWEDIVKPGKNDKTGVLLVDDEGNVIENL